MKFLIWIAASLIVVFTNTLVGLAIGIRAGIIIVDLVIAFIAHRWCESWSKKKNDMTANRYTRKENKGKQNQEFPNYDEVSKAQKSSAFCKNCGTLLLEKGGCCRKCGTDNSQNDT